MPELTFSQIKAFCKIANCSPTEIPSLIDDWTLCTNQEADKYCYDYVIETVWAFNPSFLSGMTGIDDSAFEAIQANDKCEDNNEAILSMIRGTCGIEKFVDAAISADGRGNFLSSYDGEEYELPGDLVAFRLN
jgi:hypothetical protein